MNEITEKIIKLFEENKIKQDTFLDTLSQVYFEIQSNMWEKVSVSSAMFYGLKDIIWYNLEHLPNDGEPKGLSDLRYLGTKYPHLIYCCNDSEIITCEEAVYLFEEIESIISAWNKDWYYVGLYTKSEYGWSGGDNPSKVIIYDAKTESPTRYGYNTNYGSIVGANGKTIKKLDIDTVLCAIDVQIGEYANGQILYNLLIQLREACRRSITNKKNIKIEFQQ